eukprot:jgi/Pico_ML_1/54339/g4701.t2
MGKRNGSVAKGEGEESSALRRISAGLATALAKFRRSNAQDATQLSLVGAGPDADEKLTPNKRPSSGSDNSLITSSSRKKKKEQSAIRLASPLSKVTRADVETEEADVARNLTQEFENDENAPGADNGGESEGLEKEASKSTLLAFFSPMYSLFKGGMPRPGHDATTANVAATLEHHPEYEVYEMDKPSLACEEESDLEEEYEYELFDPYFFIKNLPPLHQPGVLEFLDTVSKHFEVVIFTASQKTR